ncbi:MAG: toprim domain-containing protein [Candidatus Kaiserbacteria bacterium]|nr:toprim domain-containing protein [Candidatus Kaiserbacteria bacterium]
MQQGDKMEALTDLFKRFPGIGQRQAERFSRFIAASSGEYVQHLATTIVEANQVSKQCPDCFVSHESESELCEICSSRTAETIIVVEKDADVAALELSAGLAKDAHYFVLGNLLPIIKDQGRDIRINDLGRVVQKKNPKEVLIALSAHPDADHTGRYVSGYLKETHPDVAVSVLGRGLSNGSEIEYLDPNTLSEAFKGRVAL